MSKERRHLVPADVFASVEQPVVDRDDARHSKSQQRTQHRCRQHVLTLDCFDELLYLLRVANELVRNPLVAQLIDLLPAPRERFFLETRAAGVGIMEDHRLAPAWHRCTDLAWIAKAPPLLGFRRPCLRDQKAVSHLDHIARSLANDDYVEIRPSRRVSARIAAGESDDVRPFRDEIGDEPVGELSRGVHSDERNAHPCLEGTCDVEEHRSPLTRHPAFVQTRVVPTDAVLGGDLEDALNHVSVPAYVLDSVGVVRWLNKAAAALIGDVRGRQFSSLVVPEESRHVREAFARKIAGTARVTDFDSIVTDVSGNRVGIQVSSVQLRSGDRVVGVFGQVTGFDEEPPPMVPLDVTPRQAEVLRLLEHGRSTDEIAAELHLSRETVRNHVRGLLRSLGVRSRLEAVALAHGDLVA